jgi:hypothetical protein
MVVMLSLTFGLEVLSKEMDILVEFCMVIDHKHKYTSCRIGFCKSAIIDITIKV